MAVKLLMQLIRMVFGYINQNSSRTLKKTCAFIIGETTRIFKTPSAPKTLIIRPKEGDPLISPEKQKTFRMGAGMLLY
jgi:hypothetical protein